jgi:uncharacterized membrane protein YbaN (DUF454 family)
MHKKLVFVTLGVGLAVLSVIGLAVPILPGIVFLLLAALCFATLSLRVHGFLSRHPRFARFFRRVEQGRGLGLTNRIKLTFWASLEALGKPRYR